VFTEIETLSGAAGDARLKEMSDQFWTENAYDPGEPDRVVMCVALKAEVQGDVRWHQTYVMDAWGDADGTAMARLVSNPLAMGIEAVLQGHMPAGVSAATDNPDLLADWLGEIGVLAQHLKIETHV
jgi:hypothetical protein